jgi:malate synthase
MGGMSAFIPIKDDPRANEEAIEKVREDKLREVTDGHDGTWVAHPALVAVARDVFDAKMPGKNQLDRKREDVRIGPADLLRVPEGTRTEAGLRHNVRVGVQYIEAWLRGVGAVPLYNLMEDAATAEISRAQVWQWLRHRAVLDDGQPLTRERLSAVIESEMERVRCEVGEERFARGRFAVAHALFERVATQEHFEDFLTVPAYELLDGEQ